MAVRGRFVPAGGRGLGPTGGCVCPQCGYTEAHTPGKPCMWRRCPKCGSPMRRAT